MSAKRKSFVAATHPPHKRRGEAALQAEGRLWERTFNSVPDLIAIIDHDYRIVRVNQAMAKKLGRSPKQCVGMTCYESLHGCKEVPSFCPHALVLADGKEHAAEVQEDRLGGDFLVTVTPLRDEDGHIVGSIHVARDITEQKKAHELLRHLLEASDHEHQLISYEIHDGLAQHLAGAIIQFEAYTFLKDKNPEGSTGP